MRNRIINTVQRVVIEQVEVYSIQGQPEIKFFKRQNAVRQTCEVAKNQLRNIIILLNEVPFCMCKWNGHYDYIYNPNEDKITSPELKQLFRDKKIAIN